MKPYQNFKFLLLTLQASFILSCEKEVQIQLPQHTPRLVINSLFNPDSSWTVSASTSKGILDVNELEYINNASIKIYADNQLIADLKSTGTGKFTDIQKPLQGRKYKIVATAPGYREATAESNLPSKVKIYSLTVIDSAFQNSNYGIRAEISLEFEDPGSEKNYYGLSLEAQNNGYSSFVPFRSNDLSLEMDDETSVYASFEDELFNGKRNLIKLDIESSLLAGNTIILRFFSTTKEFYLYNKSLILYEQNKDNPFSEPVQVFNNIKGGFGIFAGYCQDADTLKKK